ncbi:MAG TPA: hypothetical protein VGO47_06560, partial [Chlamydiales bacterium]|nr:hypothetical protein [Chlamydiales bacterium]
MYIPFVLRSVVLPTSIAPPSSSKWQGKWPQKFLESIPARCYAAALFQPSSSGWQPAGSEGQRWPAQVELGGLQGP